MQQSKGIVYFWLKGHTVKGEGGQNDNKREGLTKTTLRETQTDGMSYRREESLRKEKGGLQNIYQLNSRYGKTKLLDQVLSVRSITVHSQIN